MLAATGKDRERRQEAKTGKKIVNEDREQRQGTEKGNQDRYLREVTRTGNEDGKPSLRTENRE